MMKRNIVFVICGLLLQVFCVSMLHAQKLPKNVTYEGGFVNKMPYGQGIISGVIHKTSNARWEEFDENGMAQFYIKGEILPLDNADNNRLIEGFTPSIRTAALKKIRKAGTLGKILNASIASSAFCDGIIYCDTLYFAYNNKWIEFWIRPEESIEVEFPNGAICSISTHSYAPVTISMFDGHANNPIMEDLFSELKILHDKQKRENAQTGKIDPFVDRGVWNRRQLSLGKEQEDIYLAQIKPLIISDGKFENEKIALSVELDKYPEKISMPKLRKNNQYNGMYGEKMAEQIPVKVDLRAGDGNCPYLTFLKISTIPQKDIDLYTSAVYFKNGGLLDFDKEIEKLYFNNGDFIDNNKFLLTLKDGTKIRNNPNNHYMLSFVVEFLNGSRYEGNLKEFFSYDKDNASTLMLTDGVITYANGKSEKIKDGVTESELNRQKQEAEDARKAREQDELKKLTEAYGEEMAQAIVNRKVKLGMTREMLLAMPILWETIRRDVSNGINYEIMKGIPFDKNDPEGSLVEIAMIKALAVQFGKDPYKYVTLKNDIVVSIE